MSLLTQFDAALLSSTLESFHNHPSSWAQANLRYQGIPTVDAFGSQWVRTSGGQLLSIRLYNVLRILKINRNTVEYTVGTGTFLNTLSGRVSPVVQEAAVAIDNFLVNLVEISLVDDDEVESFEEPSKPKSKNSFKEVI